ncbi:MAG: hypothetical protein A3J97_07365 [Spirochaetes bacterium RIFOXYC1_FULL_54_7]|nr:MAG: hypothetical protein A3J97_07365 [Spirochaetes bacterium RIFOXYC1_FULL_54_7]
MNTIDKIYRSDLRFDDAKVRALYDGVRALLARRSNSLVPFDVIRQRLGLSEESYRGLQSIPVDKIVGSENRHQDFSLGFRPKKNLSRQRWAKIDLAFKEMRILPPIVVYEIGGLYFVRDGNHRVSVAKDQGVAFIDAEVSSIDSGLTLSPEMSTKQMLQAITIYERDRFYRATGLSLSLQDTQLRFGQDNRYDILTADIERHLRYLAENEGPSPSFAEAAESWLRQLFLPFCTLAAQLGAVAPRRKILAADLYIWWVKYEESVEREHSACAMPEDFIYHNLARR